VLKGFNVIIVYEFRMKNYIGDTRRSDHYN